MKHSCRTGRLSAASFALVASLVFALPATTAQAQVDPGTSTSTTPGSTTTSPGMGATDPVGDNPQLGKEYNDVLAKLAKIQADLEKAQAEARVAQLKLLDLRTKTRDTQIRQLAAQTRFNQAVKQKKLRDIAQQRAERRVDRAVERLRRQAVASFVRGGDTSVLEAFMKARNGEEAGQALTYGTAALGSTDELVRSLSKARNQQRKAAKAARKAERAADKAKDDIATMAAFLRTARDRQEKLVQQVDLKVLAVNAALLDIQTKALITEGTSKGGHVDGIGQILAGIQAGEPDFKVGAVNLTIPIPGKVPSSPFGMRFHPILHVWRLHAGCDIGAPTGTEIHAPADGIVVIAGVHGGYGNYTAIDHGNSLATGYGHQSQILVHVGQFVHKGDVIGLVGSTGLSTGAHLHFETRIKGVPVNPEGLVDFTLPADYPPPGSTTTTTAPAN